MPCRSIADLLPRILEHLPPQEGTAMREAWAAVKRKYVKAGDRWLPRD
jgi:hypothetical protein